jgi:AhpD family alkylhydroperoxidase
MQLDNRIAELIAVGASVTANCQPCLKMHAARALEGGAEAQEIADAIHIARLVRKGAGSVMDRFASSLAQAVPLSAAAAEEACGCEPQAETTVAAGERTEA